MYLARDLPMEALQTVLLVMHLQKQIHIYVEYKVGAFSLSLYINVSWFPSTTFIYALLMIIDDADDGEVL